MTAIDCITAILNAAPTKEQREIKDFFAGIIYHELSRLESQTSLTIENTKFDDERDPSLKLTSSAAHKKDVEMLTACQTLINTLKQFYDVGGH